MIGNNGGRSERLCPIWMRKEGRSEEVRFELRETPVPRSSHKNTWRSNIPHRTVASSSLQEMEGDSSQTGEKANVVGAQRVRVGSRR